MTWLEAFREHRARAALRRSVRLAGAQTVAKWVLEGALPAGEDCPFGCGHDIAQLRIELERAVKDFEEQRGRADANRDAFLSQTELLDKAVRALLEMSMRARARGEAHAPQEVRHDARGAGRDQQQDLDGPAPRDPQG